MEANENPQRKPNHRLNLGVNVSPRKDLDGDSEGFILFQACYFRQMEILERGLENLHKLIEKGKPIDAKDLQDDLCLVSDLTAATVLGKHLFSITETISWAYFEMSQCKDWEGEVKKEGGEAV